MGKASAVDDFSLTSNPNGAWTYSYTFGGETTLFSDGITDVFNNPALEEWWSGNQPPDSFNIWKNVSSSTVAIENAVILPTNYLDLDPEKASSVDVIYTIQTTGVYKIDASFVGANIISENAHPVTIAINGAQVLDDVISYYGQSDSFDQILTLAAGTTIDFAVDTGSTYSFLGTNLAASVEEETSPCYLAGTHVATSRGLIPVDDLESSDVVITASFRYAPVRWIGKSTFDLARVKHPERFHPIRIRQDAMAPGVPRRDLLVSPGHALFLDGVLIPALYLLNGATIIQDRSFPSVTYYHVELDRHDVLLADGVAAESYLDTGNRHLFENGVALAEDHTAETCAPIVQSGAALMQVRERLARRIGSAVTRDPDLHLLVDGQRIDPERVVGKTYHFAIPAVARGMRIVTRANITPKLGDVPDMRLFGVAVAEVTWRADTVQRSLDLAREQLGAGFSWVERGRDGAVFRWTDGDAALPASLWQDTGAGTLEVKVTATVPYWLDADTAGDRKAA